MGEMLDVVAAAKASTYQNVAEGIGTKCLILFPTEDAKTFEDIVNDIDVAIQDNDKASNQMQVPDGENEALDQGWNVIVIDGTWSQARKMHAKHFSDESSGMLFRVQLSNDDIQKLNIVNDSSLDDEHSGKGLQLRRHPIKVSHTPKPCVQANLLSLLINNLFL
jgi:hypothetical protein